MDIQISCHFVILLVCLFKDKYLHLSVPLHITGSDACNFFISEIGGMDELEGAHDFHGLVGIANTLNHLARTEYRGDELKFGQVHNKMENVWLALHPLG